MLQVRTVIVSSLVLMALVTRAEGSTIAVDFSTDATQANIGALYPGWKFIPASASDAATVSVQSGQLRLGGTDDDPTQFQLLTAPLGAFTITVDLGAFPGNGSLNIGAQIGQNEIVFHPGHPGTALRVEGPNGFSNIDIGFTLAANVLHRFTLTGNGLGLFTITLTDAQNASQTYMTSFTNAGSVGGLFSITRAGVVGLEGHVYADNFLLNDSAIAAVPESSSTLPVTLLGICALVCHFALVRQRT